MARYRKIYRPDKTRFLCLEPRKDLPGIFCLAPRPCRIDQIVRGHFADRGIVYSREQTFLIIPRAFVKHGEIPIVNWPRVSFETLGRARIRAELETPRLPSSSLIARPSLPFGPICSAPSTQRRSATSSFVLPVREISRVRSSRKRTKNDCDENSTLSRRDG